MSDYTSYQLFTAIRNQDAALVATIAATTPALVNQADERGFLPLVLSVYLGDLPSTKALVDGGADVDANDGTGTALMGVAFKGHAEIVEYLLKEGADPAATNATGQTAVDFARMGGHQGVAAMLIAARTGE